MGNSREQQRRKKEIQKELVNKTISNMVKIEEENQEKKEEQEDAQTKNDEPTHDPYFAPIVNLPEIEVPTGEEEEEEAFKIRAKLFRFDSTADPPEWKERGTGDVKFLTQKNNKGKVRLLMRRDKTLKICANHFIQPWMILKPMKGSERALMWLVQADYADEEARSETLAIRFANADNTKKFKDAFDNAVTTITEWEAERITKAEEAAAVTQGTTQEKVLENNDGDAEQKLSQLSIK